MNRFTILFACLTLGAACSSERDRGLPDGSTTSDTSVSGDSATATPDSSTPTADSATTTPDSSTTTPDSSTAADTGSGADGGTIEGADPRAGYVGCGDTSCMSPEVCCISLSGQMCTAESSCSGGFSAPGYCDGPEDCAGGEACCVHFELSGDNGSFCRADGTCPSGDYQLCHSTADCSSGDTCTACVAPTGGFGPSYVYGLCTPDGSCPSPWTDA